MGGFGRLFYFALMRAVWIGLFMIIGTSASAEC